MKDNIIVIWLDFKEGEDSYYKEKDNCGSLDTSSCLSAASVNQAFSSDVVIEGNFTTKEAKNLVLLINSGALPTSLEELSSRSVPASFGESALNKTLSAGLIGLIIVILLMTFFYHLSGFVSSVCVIMYMFLSFLIFYLIGGVLYVWNKDKITWDNVGNIEGPPGKSEKISVGKVSSGSEATIIDNFDGEVHTLDFVIPMGQKGDKGESGPKGDKGEKGDIGPRGEMGESGPIGPQGKQGIAGPPGVEGKIGPTGPQGPQGTLGPTSYNAVCFSSFKDTTNAGTMTVTTTRIIPGNSDIISISGNQIKVSKTSVFEVTLCGRISGVTNDTGGKFYLYNATTNEKISDMEFVLDKGTTSDMDFSEVNFVDVYAGGNLEIRTEVIGNDTGNISFSMVNVILKRYNL